MSFKNVKTRFAPSPTGYLHIGGLRTALYSFLFAKKNNGKFYIRIEDTDQNRKVEGATENILSILHHFGLHPDNPKPLYQSERLSLYSEYAHKLVKEGLAYYCFCDSERLDTLRKIQQEKKLPSRYDGKCRDLGESEVKKVLSSKHSYVVRQKIPTHQLITYDDLVKGQITINTDILDDQILLKSDGWPTYHLASVVDDHDM